MNTVLIIYGILLGCWVGIGTFNLRKKEQITKLDYFVIWMLVITLYVGEILDCFK